MTGGTGLGAALSPVDPLAVEIDLNAIASNLREARRLARPAQKIIASVKADAYGHGAVAVARALSEEDVFALATQSLREAVAIREAGVEARILMFAGPLPAGVAQLLDHDLIPTVHSMPLAEALSDGARSPASVYVKVDAGLARLGVPIAQAASFVRRVAKLPNVEVEGLYTHIPFADLKGRRWAEERLDVFNELCEELRKDGLEIPVTQALGSGGLVAALDDRACSAVMPGHVLYGLSPVLAEVSSCSQFVPALRSVRTALIQVREESGRNVGFGGSVRFDDRTIVGIVPLGLANGYGAMRAGAAAMLVRGARAPIIDVYHGAATPMDGSEPASVKPSLHYTMLDLTDVPGARVGDEVVAIGRDGDEEVTLREVSEWQGVSELEVLTSISARAPFRFSSRD